ncbi:MAG: type II toxin-antitoxin system RelE/ParE family toxin [Candidatus Micrarchaeota archaeon]
MPYVADFDKFFLKRLKKLKKDNPELFLRLRKKIAEVLENPHHYKPMKNVLKGKRRAHVGSFVILFTVDEKEKSVVFLEFDHHDKAYK